MFGRLQRYVNDVKADINREMELDELRKLQKQVQTAASDFKSSVEGAARERADRASKRRGPPQCRRPTAGDDRCRTGSASDASPLPNEPGGEMGDADAVPADPPRQNSLPGFDKI